MLLLGDTGDELVDDFVAVITSMAAKISGRRSNRNRVRQIRSCIEQVMNEPEEQEGNITGGSSDGLQNRTQTQ